MQKLLGFLIITLSLASAAFGRAVTVPEIDASTGASAFALLSGGLLVLRSRRNRS